MLLPVLPGPKIIFRPVHEKSLINSGKSSVNFRPQILLANFFFSGPFWAFWPEFWPPGNTGCCPATHSPFPHPVPPLPLTPPIPSSPPTDSSSSQILKDDYHLPFCEIIILWPHPSSIISPFKQPNEITVREIIFLCTLVDLEFGQTKNDDFAFCSKLCLVFAVGILIIKIWKLAAYLEGILKQNYLLVKQYCTTHPCL